MLRTKGLIAVCTLFVFTSSIGGVCGWFLGKMFSEGKTTNNAVYEDGVVSFSKNQETVAKFLKTAKISDISEVSSVDVTSLIGVNGLTLGDIAEVSQLNTYNNDYVKMTASNLALSYAASIENKQETRSTWIKNNELYFKENISYSSMASFGERAYNLSAQTITPLSQPLDNKIEYFWLKKISNKKNVDYKSSSKSTYFVNVPKDQEINENGDKVKSFSTIFGTSMFRPFNYEFKDSNLLKDENSKYKSVEVENSKTGETINYEPKVVSTDTGYEFTFGMAVEAMENYSSYIKTTTRDASSIAKMKDKPKFKKIGVKITTDKNLLIQTLHTDELYNVISLIGEVPTTCSSDIKFTYGDKNVKIPSVSEATKYEDRN